jgi:hypothetical protein
MSGSTCGCCAGLHSETPRLVANRAGLSAIAYRAGDHGSFKRSMLAALRTTSLNTRDDDDFSIALLDAWATTADVLTFYQERIANESYLRTAGERTSILELARLIGYELAPGVAANVWLAFSVDDAEGAPGRVTLAAGSRVQSVPGQDEQPQTFETTDKFEARAEWNELAALTTRPRSATLDQKEAYFVGTDTNISIGDGLLFDHNDFRRVASVEPDFDHDRTRVTWDGALTKTSIEVMRVQASLFGHNAPAQEMFTVPPFVTGDLPKEPSIGDGPLFLDGAHPEVQPDSSIVITGAVVPSLLIPSLSIPTPSVPSGPLIHTVESVREISKADFGVAGKATEIVLVTNPDLSSWLDLVYRNILVFAAPEKLPRAEHPDDTPISGNTVTLDRLITPFEKNRAVIVHGLTAGTTKTVETELAIVAQATTTTLTFTKPLQHTYDRTSVRIFGNAGAATHGETVREVLGSGDASVSFQRFKLSHAPLTYVYAASEPDGAASTLSVFVNDIRWKEVATLHGAGRYDHVYVTRRDDDGNTYVQFGDGRTAGPRAPTGTNNIRAVYRKGLGPEGNVDAGKVTLLMSRPLGLEGVDNPLPATGGAPPQVLADARKNAPRTVVTLDRVVSLNDYQAFAAAFAGIAKAVATSTVTRNVRQVFLSVAGPGGVTFAANDATLKALRGALVAQGKPYLPLRVLSYEPAKFNLSATVAVAADHVADLVLPQVRAAVRSAFSFDARSFGEAVDRSDIVKVIHSVDGVVSVDIDALYTGSHPSLQERLPARMPEQLPDGRLAPAQILILDSDDIREKSA